MSVEESTADGRANCVQRRVADNATFFANGILHHLADSSRVQVHQIARSEYARFALRLADVDLAVGEDCFMGFPWHLCVCHLSNSEIQLTR